MQRPARIIGIDLVRSLAIFGAMLSHVLALVGYTLADHPGTAPFRFLTQIAPPTFIMLFGAMLELVYAPRFDSGQRMQVTTRLMTRAVQCVLLYWVSLAFLWAFHADYTLGFVLTSAAFLGVTPFTDILRFYALALALAPLLLLIRQRWGYGPLIVFALAVHAVWPLVAQLRAPVELGTTHAIDRGIRMIFQFGPPDMGGPSLIRGLTLVIAGMLLGRAMAQVAAAPPVLQRRSAVTAAISGALLAGMLALGGRELYIGLADMSLRLIGHPLYFLAGVLGATCATGIGIALTCRLPAGVVQGLGAWNFFGRTSLFTFSWGNCWLYMWKGDYPAADQVAWILVHIVVITAMSFAFDRAMQHDTAFSRSVRQIVAVIGDRTGRVLAALMSRRAAAN